ncbi:radical SAM protein [Candidatus Woesearchaeota archaeon]|nr:radical SAM protein [Candidatus Woesearchaeota archaeon]
MKILLVNPPWVVDGRKGVRAGSRWPHLKIPEEEGYLPYPFFMGYAVSLLKSGGYEARAIDAIAEDISYDEFRKRVADFSPDILFSETSTPSLNHDLRLLTEIKKEKSMVLVLAGPDSNMFTERFIDENPLVDFVLIGEYDTTLLDLVSALRDNKDVSKIRGMLARVNDVIMNTGRRPLNRNIDEIPWPDRDDFPMKKYHDCPGGIPQPSVQVWGSRGCPFQCSFCAWPQIMYGGPGYRPRDAKQIAEEIEHLMKETGFKSFYFDDDTFNIGKKRMLELATEFRKRQINAPWAAMCRSDLMDEEILKALRASGLHAVKYGMESAVQELVDNCHKKLDIRLAEKNILLTKSLGIKVHLTYTFGLPGETRETVNATIRQALKLDPDSVQFSIATPFPGTKLFEQMKASDNLVSYDWDSYDGNTVSVLRTDNLSPDDLKRAQDVAYKVWSENKLNQRRYRELSPFRLFRLCLREHGIKYTLNKVFLYMKNKSYSHYLGKKASGYL